MSNEITIYKIYQGKLVSTAVEETQKAVLFKKPLTEFGGHHRLYKNHVSFTPIEAVAEERIRLKAKVKTLKDRMKITENDLEVLARLEIELLR